MATQPIDRQKAKHHIKVQHRNNGLNNIQRQRMEDHGELMAFLKYLRSLGKRMEK